MSAWIVALIFAATAGVSLLAYFLARAREKKKRLEEAMHTQRRIDSVRPSSRDDISKRLSDNRF